MAFIQALNTIIVARVLNKEDFGLYSFLFSSVVPIVVQVVVLGQNSSVVRYFSKYNFQKFQWKKYFGIMAAVFFALMSILVFIICLFYKLNFYYFFCLLLSIFSSAILILISSFLRSRKDFILAIFFERISVPIFLFFIAISFLFNLKDINPFVALKTISYFLPFLIMLFLFFKNEKVGTRKIERSIYSDGLLLWGLGLAVLVITRIDVLFIAKLIDFNAVAVYSIMLMFTQIYDFAYGAVGSVYTQRFSSQYVPHPINFLLKVFGIATVISSFYLLAGRPLLHFLFNGKFDDGMFLLIPFCILGCLKLTYIYPSCYFVGKSKSNSLKLFMNFEVLGIGLKAILLILGLRYFGLLGAATSGILIWIYKNITGYYLMLREESKRRAEDAAVQFAR